MAFKDRQNIWNRMKGSIQSLVGLQVQVLCDVIRVRDQEEYPPGKEGGDKFSCIQRFVPRFGFETLGIRVKGGELSRAGFGPNCAGFPPPERGRRDASPCALRASRGQVVTIRPARSKGAARNGAR